MKKEKKDRRKIRDNEKARKKLTIKVKLTELRKARHARMTTADTILDRKYEYCVQFLTMVPHSHLLSTIYSSLVWEFN